MHHGNPKPILAVDCSTTHATLALQLCDACYLAHVPHGQQAAQLVPTMDALLKAHSVEYAQLGHILTTIGPGSFTGLRIALACVHGVALAHGIAVKSTTSLASVAWAISAETDAPARFTVALNAGKGEVFIQDFYQETGIPQAASEIALVQPDALLAHPIVYGNTLHADDPHYRTPLAQTLCTVAGQLPEQPLCDLVPLYIRPPDAKPGTLPAWLQSA
ncbi:MAG: tRNA (adenosine(37)-N6)-threonylcarbamoyltransferase complex dimerization subunit type 1 TsaB [Azospirillum brasilense]|nr:MAG: tRNA (adenosine(37)-N6)-threonylcarbamoyltransferase complex dimerization subunit type 1 TsaB [Azospirillum brasilense]